MLLLSCVVYEDKQSVVRVYLKAKVIWQCKSCRSHIAILDVITE